MRCVATVASLALLGCGPPTYPIPIAHPLLAKPLPGLHHLRTLDGQSVDDALTAGHPVVVKFFAQYCAPCMVTLPDAERVHEEHKETVFVGVDEDEGLETARALVTRFGITFPVVHDTSNALSGRFRVDSMPMTFVGDRQGTIRWVGGEGQTGEDLERAVSAALASPAAAPAPP
jgi:cytochrome c biogenesis protein CcmG/thiol:disulfide interchange protein DsbE